MSKQSILLLKSYVYLCSMFAPNYGITCEVVCQANVIKHMLQQPILSGTIRKWASH
jgi:hypothetical protein